ncbi:MAG TPA: hypothetical protein PK668_27775 [Myxococcota bacterium]|nr:hypothetical protein [Myxococcota bacterium]HRY97306.1 hypothetical protein [Myxococcota bacterium]HSA22316.1 hypothetical protein [Myxococcota bacterium]
MNRTLPLLLLALALPAACVHAQKPVRFDGPAALALEVLSQELEGLGLQTAEMDERDAVLRTRWLDTGFRYGFVDEREATIFRRYTLVLQRRPADTALTLRAEVATCPRGAAAFGGVELPASCQPMEGVLEDHQQELERLGLELQQALARLRPSPEAAGQPPAVVVVIVFRAAEGLLGSGERERLEEVLAAKLTETGRFRVIPAETVKAALTEQQRESYRQSHDTASQIELGRAVAAQKLLQVQLQPAGAGCRLLGTLYDAAEMVSEQAVSADCACQPAAIPAGLDALVRALVDKLR